MGGLRATPYIAINIVGELSPAFLIGDVCVCVCVFADGPNFHYFGFLMFFASLHRKNAKQPMFLPPLCFIIFMILKS